MHYYSLFHLIIFFSFNDFIFKIFNLFIYPIIDSKSGNWNYIIITLILTFLFEIINIFVFVEIIELNFCGLNTNLKKNILDRAKTDLVSPYQPIEEEIDEDNIIDNEQTETEQNSESNSVY